jgi:hypothetical protein
MGNEREGNGGGGRGEGAQEGREEFLRRAHIIIHFPVYCFRTPYLLFQAPT